MKELFNNIPFFCSKQMNTLGITNNLGNKRKLLSTIWTGQRLLVKSFYCT